MRRLAASSASAGTGHGNFFLCVSNAWHAASYVCDHPMKTRTVSDHLISPARFALFINLFVAAPSPKRRGGKR